MICVEFLGPIQKDSLELEANTLQEVSDMLSLDKDLKQWLDISAIAVNDTLVASLDITLKDGDKISLLPPVCGG